MSNILHGLGVLAGNVCVVALSAVAFAIILGMALNSINTIVKKGSDPNMDSVPTTIFGGLFGAIIGALLSIWLAASNTVGDLFLDMLGLTLVAAIAARIVVALVRRATR